MKIAVITLFPQMLDALKCGVITARALENKLLELITWNPRDFTENKHKRVDDRPYGGGPGMVMQVQPLRTTINFARREFGENNTVIYLSPQGKQLKQSLLKKLAMQTNLILVCGRYEGIDERVLEHDIDYELSIGDYVLSGGELAAMVLIDAITRLLPNALGDKNSAIEDSFYHNLLDHPHYTRPETYDNQTVPKVLLQGNHQQIKAWRQQQALERTKIKRPDLLNNVED
jgi:tRNA (guanine37-N1)-methyltransferase